ncbi:S8 family serine peptidase [Peptostreptococcus canis]|uniref:S8 family serine peptidase n=1 Tax=Peptostreptococcus canis TaxID=1159213 RepID=A0ABR6TMS7_9FIRM|nr:cell wall-binding repeat-containing protein [Peptostreptococcus canis]MBC2576625.1 S8 family serine peptidase [Peptostreptococcus canis]MBP1998812.1 putative cell wall-binding protein/subtilisin family serine protease [Peptostreptococcus canis]
MRKKIFNRYISLALTAAIVFTSGKVISLAEDFETTEGTSINAIIDKSSITKELMDELNKEKDFFDVMIYLKDEASILKAKKLSASMKNDEPQDDKERKAIIAELSQTAVESQDNILNWLEYEKKSGNVREFESFYIVNSIHLIAKKHTIEKLASNPEISKIDINETIEHDNPIPVVDRQNLSSSNDEIEWNIKNIGADMAWKQGITGKGVTIGIMDSAVDAQHPILRKKFKGYNNLTDKVEYSDENYFDALETNKNPKDVSDMEHGSHCMGIILGSEIAEDGEKYNQIGVAPDSQWISARIFDNTIHNTYASSYIKAAEWMLAPGGNPANAPQIINNSWGGSSYSKDPWFRETVKRWREAHILPVFAAGNQMPGESLPGPGSIVTPASYLESLAVGAVDRNGALASFSKRGPSPFNDVTTVKPEISAPGVRVRSSVKGSYAYMSGTSMAAPHVSGVAALVKSAKSSLDDKDIQKILESTATPATDSIYTTSPNHGYGHGIVNAYAAVNRALDKDVGTISGKITSNGNPIEAEISIVGTDISVKSNSSTGEFFLKYPAEEKITLTCKAYGYESQTKEIEINKNESTKIDFDLKEKLRKNLTGVVKNSNGSLISNATVYLVEDDDTGIELTDDTGNFDIKNIPVGEYTIRVFKKGYKFYDKKIILNEDSKELEVILEDKIGQLSEELYYDNGKANKGDKKNQIVGSSGEKAVAVRFNPKKKGVVNDVKIRFISSSEHTSNSARLSIVTFNNNKRMKTLLPSTRISSIDPLGDTIVNLERYNIEIDKPYYVIVEPDANKSFVVGIDSTAKDQINHSYSVDGGYFKSFKDISNKKGSLMIRSTVGYDKEAKDIQDSDDSDPIKPNPDPIKPNPDPIKPNPDPIKPENDIEKDKKEEIKKDSNGNKIRIMGKDRIKTSVEISKKYFEISDTVIIVTDKDYPDSLSAATLSKLLKAPILLTKSNGISKDVKNEILRLGATNSIIIGGNSSVSSNTERELRKLDSNVERISGSNRYETSSEVAKKIVSITGSKKSAVVVSGENFSDALTASSMAARDDMPILLVQHNKIPDQIRRVLSDLNIDETFIVGGYSSVGKDIESGVFMKKRLYGANRYETALNVMKFAYPDAEKMFIATGENFADALVIGGIAAIQKAPIQLVSSKNMSNSIVNTIAKKNIKEMIVVGGENSVSDLIVDRLLDM